MLDAELRQETDEVVRAHGEFLRRLGQQGISGVSDLVERYETVRRAAQALPAEEIDAALARVMALVDRLRAQKLQLDELSHMLAVLGSRADGAPTTEPEEALD